MNHFNDKIHWVTTSAFVSAPVIYSGCWSFRYPFNLNKIHLDGHAIQMRTGNHPVTAQPTSRVHIAKGRVERNSSRTIPGGGVDGPRVISGGFLFIPHGFYISKDEEEELPANTLHLHQSGHGRWWC